MDSDNLVAILAIVMVFGMPVAMYAIYVWYRLRRQRQRNEVIAALAEHGQPVAPELLIEPVPPYADLRRGVIWAVVGLGILGLAAFEQDLDIAGIGGIPLLIGVGYLVLHWLGGRSRTEASGQ